MQFHGSREFASACGHVRQLHKIAFEAQFGDFMLLDMGLLGLACDVLAKRRFGFSKPRRKDWVRRFRDLYSLHLTDSKKAGHSDTYPLTRQDSVLPWSL